MIKHPIEAFGWLIFGAVILLIIVSVVKHGIAEMELDRQHETLVTENVDEARRFQRDCLNRPESRVTVKFLVEAWELNCSWEARDE